jgi:hypothetical protein
MTDPAQMFADGTVATLLFSIVDGDFALAFTERFGKW